MNNIRCEVPKMDNMFKIRKSMLAIGFGTAVVLLLLAIVPNVSNVYAQTIPSTVTILGICGATPTPATINYGTLAPNAISSERTVNLLNIGNAPSDVDVSGTDWQDVGEVMDVSTTHYSTSSGSYGSKTALSTTAGNLVTIPATQNMDTFWQLQAILSNPVFAGPAAQTVTLTVTC
jgi:hypothetical protein